MLNEYTSPPYSFYISYGFQEPVNKLMLQKEDVDAIKKTMQIHDYVFKNQVKELHRLYNVQKMLMKESMKQNTLWASSGINLQSMTERSGSCSGGFDLERPAAEAEEEEEDMSTATGVSTVDEEQARPSTERLIHHDKEEGHHVELSLSIGGAKKRYSKSDREIDSIMSTSTATKPPHWLFQTFKLN